MIFRFARAGTCVASGGMTARQTQKSPPTLQKLRGNELSQCLFDWWWKLFDVIKNPHFSLIQRHRSRAVSLETGSGLDSPWNFCIMGSRHLFSPFLEWIRIRFLQMRTQSAPVMNNKSALAMLVDFKFISQKLSSHKISTWGNINKV